jgi:1,4-dihydroxy-2-naphthoate octaprenyltransferase
MILLLEQLPVEMFCQLLVTLILQALLGYAVTMNNDAKRKILRALVVYCTGMAVQIYPTLGKTPMSYYGFGIVAAAGVVSLYYGIKPVSETPSKDKKN